MRAKILTRFHKFPFFIVSLKDIGKLRSPSRQLFMLNLFVFRKERPFRPLNGLNWPFEFPNFLTKRAIISAVMQKNYGFHKSLFPQNFMFYKIYLVHFAQIAKKNLRRALFAPHKPQTDQQSFSVSHSIVCKTNKILGNCSLNTAIQM